MYTMADKKEIMIVNEQSLKEKVYVVRGQQVMLDFELAEIYGYTTTRFNEQVKNNVIKFDSDFMFQLTKEEFDNLISKKTISSWGGRRKLPFAFTEQGLYMLMTVLRGELATKQSKALIRLFKSMKDYIIENQQIMIRQEDYIALVHKVEGNTDDIRDIKDTLGNTVTRTELSDFLKLFESERDAEEILILDGQPFKADLAYQKIYGKAEKNIIVIDDYIGIKTLQHLTSARMDITITIISDNKSRNPLRKSKYDDFTEEYPGRDISFITSENRIHDRYIVVDYDTASVKIYHCGASSKDAGHRITTITEIKDVAYYRDIIREFLSNPVLILR